MTYNSNASYVYKCAAHKFYINRVIEFCMGDYLQAELFTIKKITIDNGFLPQCIKIIFDFRHKKLTKSSIKNNHKFCSFNYVPQLFEKISYVLRKYDISITAKPSAKLKKSCTLQNRSNP